MAQNRHHDSNAAAAAATTVDPFADDPFWDSWDQPNTPPPRLDIDNDEEPQRHEQFRGCEFDWGTSVVSRQQAKRQRQHEERLRKIEADMAAAKERMKKEADEAAAAKAAAAAAAAAAVEARATAKKRWNSEVERAKETLAFAKPAQALDILYSLFGDESFDGIIDFEEQANIAQMAAALELHHELQKSLTVFWSN